MIRGIRRRFIRIALAVLALAMVLVAAIINTANWVNVRAELWETMNAIDVEGGQRFFESDVLTAGENTTVFETEFGPMGLCICFDFRSQELARTMGNRGAKIIFVPGAFNMTTGPAHWEVLFRSRAIDNQLFTIGVAPARDENSEYVSYANSIAVDPWGAVIKRLGTGEEIGIVEPDLSRIDSIRRQLPIIASRKPALYD